MMYSGLNNEQLPDYKPRCNVEFEDKKYIFSQMLHPVAARQNLPYSTH
jgi:hypothetical protein